MWDCLEVAVSAASLAALMGDLSVAKSAGWWVVQRVVDLAVLLVVCWVVYWVAHSVVQWDACWAAWSADLLVLKWVALMAVLLVDQLAGWKAARWAAMKAAAKVVQRVDSMDAAWDLPVVAH